MELVQELTQQLGINQQQASGGLGLLMRAAKDKLGGDFGQVARHVPNVDSLINSAPSPQAPGGSSAGGMLGAIGGMLGGKGSGLGSLGSLAGGFQQLGLSPGIISKFVPIVLNFFQNRGGAQTRGLLEQAFAGAS
jgi:hypothetical protein